jgi:hypothetical protein
MARMNRDDPRQGRGYHGDSIYNPNFDTVPTVKESGAMQQQMEDEKLRKLDKRPNLGRMFQEGGEVYEDTKRRTKTGMPRLEVTAKKPSMLERAVGMAEEYGHGVGIPGIAGSYARAAGIAGDLKQRQAQENILAKSKMNPSEQSAKAQRVKSKFDSVDPSEEPYRKGGKVGSASRRADGIAARGKTKGKMVVMK